MDFAADVSAALAADKVVILGKRGALRSPGSVASLPESLRTVWLEAVAAVRAGDNGGKRSIMVPWDNGGSLKDVVVGVLPTAVSRHNCPAAAFAVDVVPRRSPSPRARANPRDHHRPQGRHLRRGPHRRRRRQAFPHVHREERAGRRPRGRRARGRVAIKGEVLVAQVDCGAASRLGSGRLDEETSARVVAVAKAVRHASRVVDTPPAFMDPDALVGEAAASRRSWREITGWTSRSTRCVTTL